MFGALFILMQICFRRWYGGWCFIGDKNSWYNTRTFQTIINCIVLFCFLFFLLGLSWYVTAITLAVVQFLYYAKGHGAMFDLGRCSKPDIDMLERYKKQWGYKLVCELFPKEQWYSYWFDFSLLLIRYTLPLLALVWVKWWIPFAGIIAVSGYALGWHLQDKGSKFLNNSFCNYATNLGEIFVGFGIGLMLVL